MQAPPAAVQPSTPAPQAALRLAPACEVAKRLCDRPAGSSRWCGSTRRPGPPHPTPPQPPADESSAAPSAAPHRRRLRSRPPRAGSAGVAVRSSVATAPPPGGRLAPAESAGAGPPRRSRLVRSCPHAATRLSEARPRESRLAVAGPPPTGRKRRAGFARAGSASCRQPAALERRDIARRVAAPGRRQARQSAPAAPLAAGRARLPPAAEPSREPGGRGGRPGRRRRPRARPGHRRHPRGQHRHRLAGRQPVAHQPARLRARPALHGDLHGEPGADPQSAPDLSRPGLRAAGRAGGGPAYTAALRRSARGVRQRRRRQPAARPPPRIEAGRKYAPDALPGVKRPRPYRGRSPDRRVLISRPPATGVAAAARPRRDDPAALAVPLAARPPRPPAPCLPRLRPAARSPSS